jgi:hypothetical protein
MKNFSNWSRLIQIDGDRNSYEWRRTKAAFWWQLNRQSGSIAVYESNPMYWIVRFWGKLIPVVRSVFFAAPTKDEWAAICREDDRQEA